jgi:hypothetical protein
MPVRQKMKRTQGIDTRSPHGRDLFQTPNYATDLLIPFIPEQICFIWECAAGGGKISNELRKFGYAVGESDLRGKEGILSANFLYDTPISLNQSCAIITNPPFSLKKQFYDRCIYFGVPFALLIPTDYCGWIINALQNGAEKLIPTRRIDYITPNGLSGASGHSANFHSMWLTKGFGLGKSETFVELTQEMKKNI